MSIVYVCELLPRLMLYLTPQVYMLFYSSALMIDKMLSILQNVSLFCFYQCLIRLHKESRWVADYTRPASEPILKCPGFTQSLLTLTTQGTAHTLECVIQTISEAVLSSEHRTHANSPSQESWPAWPQVTRWREWFTCSVTYFYLE